MRSLFFKKYLLVSLVATATIFPGRFLFADTLHLKNGSKVEGVVEKEDKENVEINLGFGTTVFHRSEIAKIEKADQEKVQEIWQEWGKAAKEVEARKPEEDKKWKERQVELARLVKEEEQRKKDKDEFGPKDITVNSDRGSMFVNVLINDKVRAKLVLDSGAVVIQISNRIAKELEIDVNTLEKVNAKVADGRIVQAGRAVLSIVKVQNKDDLGPDADKKPGIEAKDIEANILLEEANMGQSEYDGLLGMSFLKNFKFKANYQENKITFEKIKQEEL